MIRIVIANQKGGTGKTTVAANVAVGLAALGEKVMAVDLDTQGQLAGMLGLERKAGVAAWLRGRGLNGYAGVARLNLVVVPGDKETGRAVTDLLVEGGGQLPANLIARRLDMLSGLDYVVIDTSPAATQLQAAALWAADLVVLPAKCDKQSADSLRLTIGTVDAMFGMESRPPIYVLPTFYESRPTDSRRWLAHYRQEYGGACLPPIHRATGIAVASGQGLAVSETAPTSRAAEEFAQLVHVLRTTAV